MNCFMNLSSSNGNPCHNYKWEEEGGGRRREVRGERDEGRRKDEGRREWGVLEVACFWFGGMLLLF